MHLGFYIKLDMFLVMAKIENLFSMHSLEIKGDVRAFAFLGLSAELHKGRDCFKQLSVEDANNSIRRELKKLA